MKNWSSNGDVVTFTAPAGGTISGLPLVVGAMVLVPAFSAAAGYECEGLTKGVFEVEIPAADTADELALAFIDPANGGFDVAAGTACGVFTKAVLAGETTAFVRLDGTSVAGG